ncbi:hypothetical protein MHI48_13415 [Paenibacillus sp. FSL H7-0942]|uniref:hypothetical protein n=1 Tax=Paenibacillus TaxID=44249 RepID=UPI0015C3265E|nr:hypothetical protein [Paenibacillus amylolyticus]
MPFVITEACISEKAADCLDVCPVEAIYYEEDLPSQYLKYVHKATEFFEKQ